MDITKLEKWHFERAKEAANYLLGLVLEGKKRATSSSLWGYEIEGCPIPRVGDRSVITYWDGTPGCIIETTNVRIIPSSVKKCLCVSFQDSKLSSSPSNLAMSYVISEYGMILTFVVSIIQPGVPSQ